MLISMIWLSPVGESVVKEEARNNAQKTKIHQP